MELFSSIFLKLNKYTNNITLKNFLNKYSYKNEYIDNVDNEDIDNKDNTNNHTNKILIEIYNYINALIMHNGHRNIYFGVYILESDILSKIDKEYIFSIFSKTQKIYNQLSRFSFLYKKTKARMYDYNSDLCMNDFNTLKNNILFTIYSKTDKTIYKFRISDIINIINNALTFNNDFISAPQEIKNPYTNIPFNISELYYIYFVIKNSSYILPFLFHQLFIVDFDYSKFRLYNECYLREESIKNFINSDNSYEKKKYILSMLYDYNSYANIIIDFFFPGSILVKHFNKPYLKLYLQSIYSLNPDVKFLSNISLIQKLVTFHRLNPNYGQPYITKKRDADNNILLIYRYNIEINTDISLLHNNLDNNNDNNDNDDNDRNEDDNHDREDDNHDYEYYLTL